MRLFGGDQVAKLMTIFKMPEDVPLEHPMVSRAIEQAQVKVEGFNFDIRKHLVDYDDILNKQREIIYKLRRQVLEGKDLKELAMEKINREITNITAMYSYSQDGQETEKILTEFVSIIPFDPTSQKGLSDEISKRSALELPEFLTNIAKDVYAQKEKQVGSETMRQVERWVMLSVIDNLWMDHLDAIDDLREGIGLRGYGQLDPLVEYKKEAFSMFESLTASIDSEIVHRVYKVQVQVAPEYIEKLKKEQESQITKVAEEQRNPEPSSQNLGQGNKLGRNDPCWCGSGKKWKKCHYPKTA